MKRVVPGLKLPQYSTQARSQRNQRPAAAMRASSPHLMIRPRKLIYGACRSCDNTAAVAGRTPRQTKKASAACSTSMPKPSAQRLAP